PSCLTSPFSAVSADGRLVVAGTIDRVLVHDRREPDRTREFPGLRFVPRGLTGPLPGADRFSGAMGMVPILPFPVALTPDGRRALLGGHDGTVTLWDTQTTRPVWSEVHAQDVHVASVALSADGRWALSGGVDGVTGVWDTTGRSRPRALKVE